MRELRQHASRYLARVEAGESLQITDHGRPVAVMVPVPPDDWQALLTSGQVRLPSDPRAVWSDPPQDYGLDASAELARLREDER